MKVRAISFDPGDISQLEMKTASPRVQPQLLLPGRFSGML
jgi:hypothetical protein